MRENKQRESNVSLHLEIINYLKEKGKYPPRSVRQADLIQYGLVTLKDQAAFCETLVGREDNEYGRVLIITRNPDEISSPVRWFARGRESKLGETFVVPHIEPADSGIEVFELVKGEAFWSSTMKTM